MKAIHYINQFFGQIGAEDKADYPLEIRQGTVGPGLAFQAALQPDVEIVATIICGDNYFNENETVKDQIADIFRQYKPDCVIAGPAFNAGRYGMACGEVCKIADGMGITAFSGMFPENPGVDIYRQYGYIVPTKNSAVGMRAAVKAMSGLIKKFATKQEIIGPDVDGYIKRGIRYQYHTGVMGSKRAVDMLMAKLKGEPFETELPMPVYDKIEPSRAIKDLSKAKIAIMTTGGLVPKGNPDHIEAALATKYCKYSIDDYGGIEAFDGEVCHGGYDPAYCNENPNRMLPVDVMYQLEKEGVIGEFYKYVYVTTGNGILNKNAVAFGEAIAKDLQENHVDGILLTSA